MDCVVGVEGGELAGDYVRHVGFSCEGELEWHFDGFSWEVCVRSED